VLISFVFVYLCSRNANELATNTLRRLSLSLTRKLRQEERKFEARNSPANSRNAATKKKLQDDDKAGSVFIVTSSSASGDNEIESEGEAQQDGYRRLAVPENMMIAELLEKLKGGKGNRLCIYLDDELSEDTPVGVCLPIECCTPTILSVSTFENFEAEILVGIPIVVEADALHASRVSVSWFANDEVVRKDDPAYLPRPEDLGKTLSVLLEPFDPVFHGEMKCEAYEFVNPVRSLPVMPLITPLRDEWLTRSDDAKNQLRVMTYNLLADMYIIRDSEQHTMYSHCPAEFLCRKRRMPLLAHELLSFHADIICLQEVDAAIFSGLFRPVLESQGYKGFYSNKSSSQLEGCALFWSLEMFEQEATLSTFYLKDLFKEHQHHYGRWESLGDIDRLLRENRELHEITTEKIGQVLQLAELSLKRKGDDLPDRVLVGNTHLFYHPLADHVRTMQAYMICRQMEIERRRRGNPCPLIIGGDLNSSPLSGPVELFLQGRVGPESHDTWKHLEQYKWRMGDEEYLLEHGYIGNDVDCHNPAYEDEAFEDALQCLDDLEEKDTSLRELRLPPIFPKLISAFPEVPKFTNYAVDFAETLDYVLVSEPGKYCAIGLVPFRTAPMPQAADIKKYSAMPNEFMPSDHISLVCDLEWKNFCDK
jgi:mRNA deadenylase 3'-5' endonuclease subunit Ccr4